MKHINRHRLLICSIGYALGRNHLHQQNTPVSIEVQDAILVHSRNAEHLNLIGEYCPVDSELGIHGIVGRGLLLDLVLVVATVQIPNAELGINLRHLE